MSKSLDSEILGSCAKDLQDFIDENGLKSRVVGSLALDLLGVNFGRCCHDIDIEVLVEDDNSDSVKAFTKKIDLLEKASSKHFDGYTTHVFNWKGQVINIFFVNEFTGNTLLDKDTGLVLCDVNHVIEEKRRLNRDKDKLDIFKIIKDLVYESDNGLPF